MKKEQTVLIIDDNPTNLGVLTENLKSWGFDFMVARNGESGLKKAVQGKPDFILLDIYMPGMDGFEVCDKLKSDPATSEIPVIFLTADTDQSDKIKAFKMGAVDYITKPFQSEEVLARINRHLEIHILRKELEIQNAKLEREIIERRKAEDKQRELEAINMRLQKAESLGQMAGGIAHIFNNYLYVVIGNLELALADLPDGSLISENLIEAIQAAQKSSDISGSMLTYLGQTVVNLESIDISECCQKCLSMFKSSNNNSAITIESNLLDRELIVRANSGQMHQVLNHLISNAFESIVENSGRIRIATKIISGAEISKFHIFPAGCKPSSDIHACIEVSDTGYGIPEETIDKIFDPFFTTKFIGRGLGLAIVLGITKVWGGMIGVASEPGYGSSFMLFLPLSSENFSRKPKKPAQAELQIKSSLTVLVVDDHKMVRNMTAAMLKRMGFEVIEAENGSQAIEILEKSKESVNCLITDLSMPGLDGWATLDEIRKIKPGIPAILASGYDEAFAMSRDNSEKPQAFLHKPYSINDLKIALEKAINLL
ncbi:MAG: response regulator [Desulfamplus sp.]|nr:response regulator [Desulfamplus sp.]